MVLIFSAEPMKRILYLQQAHPAYFVSNKIYVNKLHLWWLQFHDLEHKFTYEQITDNRQNNLKIITFHNPVQCLKMQDVILWFRLTE